MLENTQRPRPLHFDPDVHKVLISELKHLYTAVTRARVNVWVFDEDLEARAPMFEYFKAHGLVQVVQPRVLEDSAVGDGQAGESVTDETTKMQTCKPIIPRHFPITARPIQTPNLGVAVCKGTA